MTTVYAVQAATGATAAYALAPMLIMAMGAVLYSHFHQGI
jgi:hypothetical protein